VNPSNNLARRQTRTCCPYLFAFTKFTFLFLSLAIQVAASGAEFPDRTVRCGDRMMGYQVFVPPPVANTPLPVLLLLHGAGDQAANIIKPWEELAKKQGIVLVAPQLPRELSFEAVAPKVFRCVIEDATRKISIDQHRIYLFGHSMGGYLAYDSALLDSGYYAAAVIHAMGIEESYTSIIGKAERKMPIAIYIGDRDEMVSHAMVRKTRDLLKKAGFPIEYREIMDHTHNYYEISDLINDDAWKFLRDHRLP
jgi:predicted esterase